MKQLKNIMLAAMLLTGGAMVTTSCTDYQDEIDALEYRVTVLENLVKKINTDLDALRVIADVLENGDYITDVRETEDGYLINFQNAGPIQIIDGKDGKDGKDAQAPNISIAQDPDDGEWYWMVNGEVLVVDGQKIRVNGKDGKDAVSPQVRINPETGIWEISTDGGETWTSTGTSATGKDGKDGENGANGNQFFESVTYEVTAEGEFMVITTKSGQKFRIPIYHNN